MLNKIVLISCFCSTVLAYNAPVFIWGSSKSPPEIPALTVLTSDEFTNILARNFGKSMILVFLEKDLQLKDITQCKLPSGETCFSNLKAYQTKTFYTNVEDPVDSIKTLKTDYNIELIKINSNGKLSKEITYNSDKIFLLSFEEITKERSKVLTEHDAIMKKVYNSLENKENIVGIYTSKEECQDAFRKRRDVEGEQKELSNELAYADSLFLSELADTDNLTAVAFFASNITFHGENIELISMKITKDENFTEVTLTTDIDEDIKLKITDLNDYWYIHELIMGDYNISSDITAKKGFSYACGDVSYSIANGTLNFKNLQIEIFHNISNVYENNRTLETAPTKFGNHTWHCVGFVSGGILCGLFITFMFMIVISIGITWLLDIRTMDKFADPKGKILKINASE